MQRKIFFIRGGKKEISPERKANYRRKGLLQEEGTPREILRREGDDFSPGGGGERLLPMATSKRKIYRVRKKKKKRLFCIQKKGAILERNLLHVAPGGGQGGGFSKKKRKERPVAVPQELSIIKEERCTSTKRGRASRTRRRGKADDVRRKSLYPASRKNEEEHKA